MSDPDRPAAGTYEDGVRAAAELALEMAREQDKLAERATPPMRQAARDRAEAYREVARRLAGT